MAGTCTKRPARFLTQALPIGNFVELGGDGTVSNAPKQPNRKPKKHSTNRRLIKQQDMIKANRKAAPRPECRHRAGAACAALRLSRSSPLSFAYCVFLGEKRVRKQYFASRVVFAFIGETGYCSSESEGRKMLAWYPSSSQKKSLNRLTAQRLNRSSPTSCSLTAYILVRDFIKTDKGEGVQSGRAWGE